MNILIKAAEYLWKQSCWAGMWCDDSDKEAFRLLGDLWLRYQEVDKKSSL